MKKILCTLTFILVTSLSWSQVGIGTTSVHASAIVEVSSTTKGILIPSMTKAQISAISTPAEGLMVYCSDSNIKSLYVFNGSEFISLTTGGETIACGSCRPTAVLIDLKRLGSKYVVLQRFDAPLLKKHS